jgi:tetratricopeptide (TPR) repeat protein
MNKKISNIIYFGLVTFISVILLTQTSVAAFKNVSVGTTAPDITLKNTDGADISLETLYNDNKIVLIVFWATWSPRSVQELKDLQTFYDSYKEKGVEIFAINVENEDMSGEDVAKIKSLIQEMGLKFNVVLDEGLSNFRGYGVVAIPSTAIIAHGGDIIKDYASYATFAHNDIKNNIEYELGIAERPKEVEIAVETKKYKPLKTALLHYGLGKTLIARGMPDKAIREFKKASELDDKFDQPYIGLGEAYYNKAMKQRKKAQKSGYLTTAKEEFLKAVEINSESLPALSGLALVLLENNNDTEAEKHLNKVLNMEPNFTPALSAMGVLFKNRGDKDKAIEKFNAALELNPNQPKIHYLKALTYKEAGENKLAVASFKESFKFLIHEVSLAMIQESKE